MLKSGQKEVTTKDCYGQRQITDIFTIGINKLVVSDKVPANIIMEKIIVILYDIRSMRY